MWDFVEWVLEVAVVPFYILLVACLIYTGIKSWQLNQECLRAGYPSYQWSFFGPAYCIKRLDQTDVVIPIEVVRRGAEGSSGK